MSDEVRTDQPLEGELEPALLDDIQNLYIGRIVGAKGSFVTAAGPVVAALFGEVLIYGRVEEGRLIAERLRRVALYGAPAGDDPAGIGVVSLAGPLDDVQLEPGPQGEARDVLLQLHYPLLSAKQPPLSASDDAVFPRMERIAARLGWEPAGTAGDTQAGLVISFAADDVAEQLVGLVQAVTIEPAQVVFQLAGSGEPFPPPHFSLPSNCAQPAGGCRPEVATVTRWLGLRFVNLSTQTPDVEAIGRTQIDSACQVWRTKAACQLLVDQSTPAGVPVTGLFEASGPQKNAYSWVDVTQERALPALGFDHVNYVEVYLVDALLDRPGGGITHNCGQASAFCILDLGKARLNPFLLSHELGHVLGLAHIDGLGGVMPSSAGSVMEAAAPNPNINTLFNCQVMTARPNQGGPQPLALNPIVGTTPTADCFRPDRLA
jgi:hypothetical protein